MNTYKIAWGTILSVIIALVADMILKILEKRARGIKFNEETIEI